MSDLMGQWVKADNGLKCRWTKADQPKMEDDPQAWWGTSLKLG